MEQLTEERVREIIREEMKKGATITIAPIINVVSEKIEEALQTAISQNSKLS